MKLKRKIQSLARGDAKGGWYDKDVLDAVVEDFEQQIFDMIDRGGSVREILSVICDRFEVRETKKDVFVYDTTKGKFSKGLTYNDSLDLCEELNDMKDNLC